jgi:hypothetical protein
MRLLEASGNSKKLLHAMAVGVKEEDSDLLLVRSVKFQEEPYASSRARKSFVPRCKDLQKEALR